MCFYAGCGDEERPWTLLVVDCVGNEVRNAGIAWNCEEEEEVGLGWERRRNMSRGQQRGGVCCCVYV